MRPTPYAVWLRKNRPESTWICRFTSGTNGFDTNAYCIGGGTGADFAQYLFPKTFLGFVIRPALTVRQAWASMAVDKEPSGVRYRSMGPIGSGWVTNMSDHFWGQGTTGPDIPKAGRWGMWAISGTV